MNVYEIYIYRETDFFYYYYFFSVGIGEECALKNRNSREF